MPDLAKLKELIAASAPGPWEAYFQLGQARTPGGTYASFTRDAELEMFVALANAAPGLITAAERLERVKGAIEALLFFNYVSHREWCPRRRSTDPCVCGLTNVFARLSEELDGGTHDPK